MFKFNTFNKYNTEAINFISRGKSNRYIIDSSIVTNKGIISKVTSHVIVMAVASTDILEKDDNARYQPVHSFKTKLLVNL